MRRMSLFITLFVLIAGSGLTVATLLQPSIPYTLSDSTSLSIPVVSVSEPIILDPPLDVGKTFTVNITVEQVSNLYLWQAGLTFNASVLEVIDFSEGTFLRHGGITLWVNGTLNNTDGSIVYHAASLTGNTAGVSGNGTLGTITFSVKRYGNSTLHPTDVILLDPTLSEFPEVTVRDYNLRIKIPGDISGDNLVSVWDLYLLGKAYGSKHGDPNWNIDADINLDNIVDDIDLSLLNENYGTTVD